MERKLYYFIACVFSILCSASFSSVKNVNSSGKSSVDLPVVKYGMQLKFPDMWNIQKHGSMVGIIGGTVTDITHHPFQIAIDNNKSFVCAGALLNRIWAISLASCIEGATASSLTVRSGSDSNVNGGTVFNVTQLVVHPLFNYSSMDYDFALLKLNTYMSVLFIRATASSLTVRSGSDSNVNGGTVFNVTQLVVHPLFNYSSMDYDFALLKLNTYICYNDKTTAIEFSSMKPKAQYSSVVTGWGSDKDKPSNVFRQLNMTIVSNSVCTNKYSNVPPNTPSITDRMFCAKANNKGPCHNDFGDPLVVNGTLYGLYSWSLGCADPRYPAVFSNLASVSDWINTTMNNAFCVCGLL